MRLVTVGLLLALGSCAPSRPPALNPVYLVGAPYQAGGVWRYPRENFDADETGLASVAADRPGLTANGEMFDQTALAAGHRSLQLPALARITNLENGREVVVRLNDRGPADPARLVELTRRTALLLAAADARAVQVRVQVLEAESRQLAMEWQGRAAPGAAPTAVQVSAAPPGGVQAEALAPPPGASVRGPRALSGLPMTAAGQPPQAAAAIPLRLPEAVTQGVARPGVLAIDCGGFGRPEYAEIMRARLASLGAVTATSYAAARDRAYRVRVPAPGNVAQAEAILARALAAGASDARIIIE